MLLAQLKARGLGHEIDDDEYSFLLEGGSDRAGRHPPPSFPFLSTEQQAHLQAFQRLPCFKDAIEHVSTQTEAWETFLKSACPEYEVPNVWPEASHQFFFHSIFCFKMVTHHLFTAYLILQLPSNRFVVCCYWNVWSLTGCLRQSLSTSTRYSIQIFWQSSYNFDSVVTTEINSSLCRGMMPVTEWKI